MLRVFTCLALTAAFAAPALADDATKSPEPKNERAGLSLALGWGGGALPENDEDMFSSGVSYVLQAGFRVHPSLWLVFDNRVLSGAITRGEHVAAAIHVGFGAMVLPRLARPTRLAIGERRP